MGLILTIILILILLAALPTWPYSNRWGYGPSGALAAILVVLLVLILLNVLPIPFWFGPPAGPAPTPGPAPTVP